jgi:hypothetical protein
MREGELTQRHCPTCTCEVGWIDPNAAIAHYCTNAQKWQQFERIKRVPTRGKGAVRAAGAAGVAVAAR